MIKKEAKYTVGCDRCKREKDFDYAPKEGKHYYSNPMLKLYSEESNTLECHLISEGKDTARHICPDCMEGLVDVLNGCMSKYLGHKERLENLANKVNYLRDGWRYNR